MYPSRFFLNTGLTRMGTNDMKNRPMEIGIKLPLDGGTLYQIAVPRQPCLPNFSILEQNG